ncbi:MAG: SpoIIE family protein phosphatase [Lachnospiraceae bacterium]|nr:SpoIIE family protein phosphatase [Lachnospiraceae bacterium]
MVFRNKKTVHEMSKAERRRHSLAAKTVRSTVISCILFGLVAEFVAVAFYAYSITKQYISVADSAAHQAVMSATHGADAVGFSEEVMKVYYDLVPEQRAKMGTNEYRELYGELDIDKKGGEYDVLINMLTGTMSYYDVYDVYIGMYDEPNGRLIYVVDADPNLDTRFYPGDWESVSRKEIKKFLAWNGEGKLYDIEWTDKYGLLCTVGLPMKNEAGEIASFMLVDISVENVLVGMGEFALQLTLALVAVTLLLAWLQTKRIKRTLVEPINRISEASVQYVNDRKNHVSGTEHFSQLDIHTGDEIENLSLNMASMERELEEYETSLTQITAEKERIGTELSLATKIQAAMLPRIFPPFPERTEFDLYAMMQPARQVGGDFYDFFLIDEDHLCLVIADVSGKGIPAALFMMISKTILQSCAMLGKGAAETLTKMNEALSTNNQARMFVTVWVGILEISTGRLTAANGGHEYPVLKRKDGAFELIKDKHGFVIGGRKNTVYHEYELQLEPGDIIYVYTDGVPEATNANMKMFGTERMVEVLNRIDDADPKALIDGVYESVNDFVKEAEPFDDITMLCLTYKGAAKSETEDSDPSLKSADNGGSGTTLTVEAVADNFPKVVGMIEEGLNAVDCSPADQMKIQLAVEEIYANVTNYAYAPQTGNVTVTFETEEDPKAAVITFADSGVPYNPLLKADPDISPEVRRRTKGGLGIFMVKKNVDDISYEYRDGQNILRMKKLLP